MSDKKETQNVNETQSTGADVEALVAAAVEKALKAERESQDEKVAAAVEKALENERAKSGSTVGNTSKAVKTPNPLEKKTKVKIIKTKDKTEDVVVSVNGRSYQIKRGVEVEVPLFVKEVLDNMEKMDEISLERMEAATKNFAR